MHVRTYLRELREARGLSLADVERKLSHVPINRARLSCIERGEELPRDAWLLPLVSVYGLPSAWYPAGVHRVLLPDVLCAGCAKPLAPESSSRRRYHSERCRSRARRRRAGALS